MQRHSCLILFALFLGCASTRTERSDSASLDDAGADDVDANVDANFDAGIEAFEDAARDFDASTDADVAVDSGSAMQLCYVYDDCNGGTYNDYSASACPSTEPAIGSACTLAPSGQCFYCMSGQSALHWFTPIPLTRCEAGLWIRDQVNFYCQ